jgi:hypothetical protein
MQGTLPEKFQISCWKEILSSRALKTQLMEITVRWFSYMYKVDLLTLRSDHEISVDDTDGELAIDKAKVLFGDNYQRLQSLKKKYDPEVLFSKWFAITPA